MAAIKITLAFQNLEQGWTESYILNNPVPGTLASFNTLYAIPLANVRAALLSVDCTQTWIRISLVGVPFAVQVFNGVGAGTYSAGQSVPNLALLLRCPPISAGPQKAIYAHGIPGSQISQGIYRPSFDFLAAVGAFQRFLTSAVGNSGWGWYGVASSTKVKAPLNTYTITPGYQVLLTFNAVPLTQQPIFAGVPIGTKIQLRLSGVNTKSELNGVQVCLVNSANAALTAFQFGVLPYSHGGQGVYEPKTFIQFGGVNDEKVVTRKTGKPLFLAVGRSRNRART